MDSRSWAGLGFIIAPQCRHMVKSYKQVSDRLCTLRMKVVGGILGLVTAYAPHNLHSLPDRFQFYVDLDIQFRKLSANVANMNARLGAQLPGEDHIIGPYTFGRRAAHQVETPNRDVLL